MNAGERDKRLEAHMGSLPGSEGVFITAVPITKLFARGGGGMEDMCATRDYEPRPV